MGIVGRLRGLRGGDSREVPSPSAASPQSERLPFHVGIIMDGNGRWAKRRRLPVVMGHREGTKALMRAVEAAMLLEVRQLTVYSFSTENWARPEEEVRGLLGLIDEMIDQELPRLHENGVRVEFVARRDGLDPSILEKFARVEELTAANEKLDLFVAFNYGGRAEIVDAIRAAAAAGVDLAAVDEATLASHMYCPRMRDPDLVIRTSGENRLSNFLLWQSAYSEFYFSDVLWPDFDEVEFRRALLDYATRSRRFGAREAEDLA
ncbi:MAG: di-trans,poly-cis-decaprenylcistransferase [Actinobacteria bacterium]|nr:di-trans,poly-cis-decaprenylcistransferase [Actinomycetota bacterium]